MKCNIIAQRIHLQEYLTAHFVDIDAEIQAYLDNEEEAKTLDRNKVESEIFESWLKDFKIYQP